MQKIKKLTETELKEISGGSEITDAIWYGLGAAYGYCIRVYEKCTAKSYNSRFR